MMEKKWWSPLCLLTDKVVRFVIYFNEQIGPVTGNKEIKKLFELVFSSIHLSIFP
jgi:hypothetical protein